MKLATKKFFHNLLAVVVSVCMVCTMTPSLAWATSGSGSGASDSDAAAFVGNESGKATGESIVHAQIRNDDFAFNGIANDANYEDKGAFVASLDKNPLWATMPYDGIPENYTITWYIQEVAFNPDYDEELGEGPGNEKVIRPSGNATPIFEKSYTKDSTPMLGNPSVPTFEYPGNDSAAVKVQPQDLPMEKEKTYEFSIIMQDGAAKASSYTTITLLGDYPIQVIGADDDEVISVRGNIYQKFTPWPVGNLGVAVLQVSTPSATSTAFEKLKKEANAKGQDIEAAKQIELINDALPEGERPYVGSLDVRLPVPNGLEDAEPGTKVKVYMLDADGKLSTIEGVIDWAIDPNSNPIGEPLDIPAVRISLSDTGVELGTFAVGVPINGSFTLTTIAQAGGSVSPAYDAQPIALSGSIPFGAFVIAPHYRFTGWKLTVNGTDVSSRIPAADKGYNQVTINPTACGISENDDVVLEALFASANLTNTGSSNLKASASNDSGASGYYNVSTVYVPGKLASGNDYAPAGTQLNKERVDASSYPASRPLSKQIGREVGVLIEFNPGANSHVESVTVNDQPAMFQGNSLFIGTAYSSTLHIHVTFASGAAPEPETNEIQVSVQKRPNGNIPATLTAPDGSKGDTATYAVSTGGSITIYPEPYRDTYVLTQVLVVSPADAPIEDASNIVQHVYVSSPSSFDELGSRTPDGIQLYNITADMRVELVYEMTPGKLTGGESEGVEWGWEKGDGGNRNAGTQGTRMKAAAKAASNSTTSTYSSEQEMDLGYGEWARLTLRAKPGYVLDGVYINGNRVNSLLKERKQGNTTVYTLTVFRGEVGSAPEWVGSYPDDGGDPDNIFYFTSLRAEVTADDKPAVITTPSKNMIGVTTSVTQFGGGSITPSLKVLEGQNANVYFFPDDGYRVDKIWVDNGIVVDDPDQNEARGILLDGLCLTLLDVQSPHSVQVSFTPGIQEGGDGQRYTVRATARANGTISPSGSFLVYANTTQQLVLAPNTGYQVSTVEVNGEKYAGIIENNTISLSRINEDKDVVVTFKSINEAPSASYNVTTSKTGEGTVTPNGSFSVASGADANLTIIPEQGWYVQDIRIYYKNDNSDLGISGMSLYNHDKYLLQLKDVREDTSVSVIFKEGDENGNIPGGGQVPEVPDDGDKIKINPGNLKYEPEDLPGAILSPSLGELELIKEEGTDHANVDQPFTVTVMEGYEIDDPGVIVKDSNGNPVNVELTQVGEGVYTFTVPKEKVTEDMTIEVRTQPKKGSSESVNLVNVEVSCAGDGYITPGMQKVGDGARTVQVESGKNQTFNFIPADGWKLHAVYVGGKPTVVSGNVLTVNNITQDGLKVEAVFSKLAENEKPPTLPTKYPVNITVVDGNDHGRVYPMADKVEVYEGGNLTITTDPRNTEEASYKAIAKVNGEEWPIIGNSIELSNINKKMDVEISFILIVETQFRTLTVHSDGPGTTSPAGTSLVVDGARQVISLIPDTGKRLESVEVNGIDWLSPTNRVDAHTMSITLNAIYDNTTVEVRFCDELGSGEPGADLPKGGEVTYYDVTTTVPYGGGVISPSTAKVARDGETYLSIDPLDGYMLEKVEQVTNGGTPVDRTNDVQSATNTLRVAPSANTEITAYFTKTVQAGLEEFYSVFVKAEEGGTVSPTGAMAVPAGGSQTFTILPDLNKQVKDVLVNGASTGFKGNSYTLFNITKDTIVTVMFEEGAGGASVMTHDVTATSSVGGRISPEGTVKVAHGKNASFTFIPNQGYKLSYVEVDNGASVIPAQYIINGQYIFTNVQENHMINAVFVEETTDEFDYVAINVNPATNGSINPAGEVIAEKGKSKTFTVTAFYGYKPSIINVGNNDLNVSSGVAVAQTIDGVCTAKYENGQLTLSDLASDVTIGAIFEKSGVPSNTGGGNTYVPVTGTTTGGGTTSIGKGGYIEQPGDDVGANDPERHPQVTVTPNPGYAVEKVAIEYGDGSKDKITDNGTFRYDKDGNLLGSDGKTPVSPTVKYPNEGNPPKPTAEHPNAQDIYTQGYVQLDADEVAERGGVSVNVSFRELKPGNPLDDRYLEGQKPNPDPSKNPIEQPTYFEIDATYSGGGRMFPEGRVKVAAGQNMVFQMLPSSGYDIASLTVDGKDAMDSFYIKGSDGNPMLKANRTYVFSGVDTNHSINAQFGFIDTRSDYKTVKATSSEGPDCVSPANSVVPVGSDVVVYFFPPADRKVAAVEVKANGVTQTYDDEMTRLQHMFVVRNIAYDTEVNVVYEGAGGENAWTVDNKLTVTAESMGGNGEVTPTESVVPAGSPQTFYFKPSNGYVVDYVMFNGNAYTLRDNPATFSATPVAGADNHLTAYFRQATTKDKQYTTIAPVVNGGEATINPSSMSVEVGSTTSFYVYPKVDGGSKFTIKDVKVNGWTVEPTLPDGTKPVSGKVYSAYKVTLEDVQPNATVEVNLRTALASETLQTIKLYNMTITGENALYDPMGVVQVPAGGQQIITINSLTGYALDSIIVTDVDANGNPVGDRRDLTDQLVLNQLTVPMYNSDCKVTIKYVPVGTPEFSPAYVNVTSATIDGDKSKPVTDFTVGMFKDDSGNVVPLRLENGSSGKILNSEGESPFARGESVTLYVKAADRDGKQLVLSGAIFKGQKLTVPELTNRITDLKVVADGNLELIFTEDDRPLLIQQEYQVKFTITGGKGSLAPVNSEEPGFPVIYTTQMGNRIPITYLIPGDDDDKNWMVKSVTKFYYDKEWNLIGSEQGDPVSPTDYKDGTYAFAPTNNTVVAVEFVECALVEVNFNKALGFVAPNPPDGQYLRLEAGSVGNVEDEGYEPFMFIVAPKEDCYVSSFDVVRNETETQSYLEGLQQTTGAVRYVSDAGLEVKDATYAGGVTKPTEEAIAQAKGADMSVYTMQSRAVANVLSMDPIDYNGYVPPVGTKLQNAYEVGVDLHPTNTAVNVGLYSVRQPDLQQFTIHAEAKGNGRIEPSGDVLVWGGQPQVFNLIADKGYQLNRILVDGNPVSASDLAQKGTTYRFENVDRNHTIVAEFGPITSNESSRLLRVASRLAQTGDLTGPAVGALLMVAAIGLLVTAVSYVRRQQRRRRRMQGMR